MAHKTLIGGTAYEITGGKTLVGGTAYKIEKGKTLIGGTGYTIDLSTGFKGVLTFTDYGNASMSGNVKVMSAKVLDASGNTTWSGMFKSTGSVNDNWGVPGLFDNYYDGTTTVNFDIPKGGSVWLRQDDYTSTFFFFLNGTQVKSGSYKNSSDEPEYTLTSITGNVTIENRCDESGVEASGVFITM